MKKIISAVLLIAIAIGCALVLSGCEDGSERLDYLNDDLTKYVKIDKSDYTDYDIKVNIPDVTDLEVENAILQDLASKKGALRFEGDYIRSEPVRAGDKVYIRYRGYTVDENGYQVEIDSSSNFGDSYDAELIIGSGQFVTGFELGLLGKVPNQYSKFEKRTADQGGKVLDGDVVYLDATYVVDTEPDIVSEIIRIDLRDPNIEDIWGVGIRDYIMDMTIGISDTEPITLTRIKTGERVTFTYGKIEYVTRCEENPITLTATFPHDYSEESLRNKQVYFDVYIAYAVHYESATLDESFVTEKLGLTAERLAEYEGEGIVEKYRSYKKASLVSDRETDIRYAAEDAMWEHLREVVEIKEYPKRELQRVFNDYYYQFQLDYAQNYTTTYKSVDAYIRVYYGLSDDGESGDWQAVLTDQVKNEIAEKLIFYSILRMENMVPDEAKYLEIYEDELRRDFEYYGKTPYDYATEEEYLAALREYETQILQYYGEEFYRESVYYNYASKLMLDLANVTNSANS